MNNSVTAPEEKVEPLSEKDRRLSIIAQALYLLNISVLPILAFLIQLIIYKAGGDRSHRQAVEHQRQAILASITAGILLIIISGLILFLGGFSSPYTWVLLITYFISIHSALILYGVFAIIKAIVDEPYRYPILGRFWVVKS